MGDRAGLFPGVVHQWDGLHERLSLNFQLNTDHFDFRLYADDLSFSDDSEDAVLFSGNVLSFTLSRTWPVEIAFELFSALSYNDIGSSVFYPTLFIDAPIVNTDTLAFALRFGTLTRMEKFSLSELFKGESSFFFSIPFSIDDDEMSIGFYVQKEGVYYNLYNENYKPMVTDEDSIAVFFDADLNFDRFDLSINTFLNLSSPALSLINENSYLDVAISFMIGNMDFLMGVRKQNLFEFDDFLATSDFYFGLGAKTGSIETELQLRYRNGHPEIGFSSSLAFIDIDNNVYMTVYGSTALKTVIDGETFGVIESQTDIKTVSKWNNAATLAGTALTDSATIGSDDYKTIYYGMTTVTLKIEGHENVKIDIDGVERTGTSVVLTLGKHHIELYAASGSATAVIDSTSINGDFDVTSDMDGKTIKITYTANTESGGTTTPDKDNEVDNTADGQS